MPDSFIQMFFLSTERLSLRHIQASDAELFYDVFCDAEVMRFSDGVKTKEWVDTWVIDCADYYMKWGYGPYAVEEKESERAIGYCGLFYFPDVNGQPEVEIGYRLARSTWGKDMQRKLLLP